MKSEAEVRARLEIETQIRFWKYAREVAQQAVKQGVVPKKYVERCDERISHFQKKLGGGGGG